jgi:hypothetical protein
MGDNSFKLYDVIERILYYHNGSYLDVYFQGQGHFCPSEIGSKVYNKVLVVTISLGSSLSRCS